MHQAAAGAAVGAVNDVMTSECGACELVMSRKLVLKPPVHFSSRRLFSDYVTRDL